MYGLLHARCSPIKALKTSHGNFSNYFDQASVLEQQWQETTRWMEANSADVSRIA